MVEQKTKEVLDEAREKHAKKEARMKRVKLKEGYKYYVNIKGIIEHLTTKMYFRNLKSAQDWVAKHQNSQGIYKIEDSSKVE